MLDTVFQVNATPWKFGCGAIRELGSDLASRHLNRVVIFTDKEVEKTEFFQKAIESLSSSQFPSMEYVVYNEVRVEPTEDSFEEAGKFVQALDRQGGFRPDCFVSIGGGSVIDTCKAASLYSTLPAVDGRQGLREFMNVPIGKGKGPLIPLRPHIACPTTAGTGSEGTGIAICTVQTESGKAKTGIVHAQMYPSLAIVDPEATLTLHPQVTAASGFDVLSHAIESYTARPFHRRSPAFPGGKRPLIQGKNPYADIGCRESLRLCGEYLVRAIQDPHDLEARIQMSFAATLAGFSMGNAGTQLPHGLSYAVSSSIKSYQTPGYPTSHPLLPHGQAVILHAPSVARFSNPYVADLQLEVIRLLGYTKSIDAEEAGEVLAEILIDYMRAAHVPSGLKAIGFTSKDIPDLVEKAWPQKRVIDNAPFPVTKEILAKLYENALSYWDD